MSIAAACMPSSKSMRPPCLPRPKLTCNHGGPIGTARAGSPSPGPFPHGVLRVPEGGELRVREGDAPGPTYVAAVQREQAHPRAALQATECPVEATSSVSLRAQPPLGQPAHCSLAQTLSG